MGRILIVAVVSMLVAARTGCGGHPIPGGSGSGSTAPPPKGTTGNGSGGGGTANTDPEPGGQTATELDIARKERALSDVRAIVTALERLREDTGTVQNACFTDVADLTSAQCPTVCGHLQNCATASNPGDICWGGPYLNSLMVDPWGNAYSATTDGFVITVHSAGPDGQPATPDDIEATG